MKIKFVFFSILINQDNKMIIDCISDLHGYYPKLEGGDLLIVAGDLTATDKQAQYLDFRDWLRAQNYKKKVFIAGNHDGCIEKGLFFFNDEWMGAEYLCDSGTEFERLKIWGSSWTAQFPGINPHCCAFTVKYSSHTDDNLNEHWKKIPIDTDILITHSPPYGILDKTKKGEHVGSGCLLNKSMCISPKLHVFGHIHECGGKMIDTNVTKFVNASIVNEHYEHMNKPIRIIL